MEWIIGLLVIGVVALLILLFMMYLALECKEGIIYKQNDEYQKLMSKYEHVLTQVGDLGYEVKMSYSDSCYIESKK